MSILTGIILTLLGLYGVLVLWMLNRKVAKKQGSKEKIELCIVIAARNEAENLKRLLPEITGKGHRVIVVDDHSSDATAKVAEGLGAIVLSNEKEGKKAALQSVLQHISEQTILFLDADIIVPEGFLKNAKKAMQERMAKVHLFPIYVKSPKGFQQSFDASDLLSLIYTTKAFADADKAIMGNGAALAVDTQFYREALGALRADIMSGDDTFLVQYATSQGEKVVFLDEGQLAVGIDPNPSWGSFLKQRIRWGKKTPHYASKHAKAVGWLVFLSNLAVCFAWLGAFWNLDLLYIALFKGIIDLDFFHRISGRMNQRYLRKYLLLTTLFYPFYIVAAALGGLFVTPSWKGRQS